jgi:hypothetical protein
MKRPALFLLLLASFVVACQSQPTNPYPAIGNIPPPSGYGRNYSPGGATFAAWLRKLPLKTSRTVYLYNGRPKANQTAQFAVLDISVGNTDLQQCADAVMRLRAEWLYANHSWGQIFFFNEQGRCLKFPDWARHRPDSTSRSSFDAYLRNVFMYCSTRTLDKQMRSKSIEKIEAGDVFLKGANPGHAMIVVDMACNAKGEAMFLLAQSYMPAQDIHIVNNPMEPAISPWFRADKARVLFETPEWTFTTNQLRSWDVN